METITISVRVDAVNAPSFADDVVRRVGRRLGVTPREIRGRSRERHVSRARHAVWGLLDAAGWSAYAIAREFGVGRWSVLEALQKPRRREGRS